MAERHVPGRSLHEHRVVDRDAAARRGVTSHRDHDQDPYYSSEEACWPLPVDEAEQIRGRCDCGSLLRPNGVPDMLSCDWCGARRRLG